MEKEINNLKLHIIEVLIDPDDGDFNDSDMSCIALSVIPTLELDHMTAVVVNDHDSVIGKSWNMLFNNEENVKYFFRTVRIGLMKFMLDKGNPKESLKKTFAIRGIPIDLIDLKTEDYIHISGMIGMESIFIGKRKHLYKALQSIVFGWPKDVFNKYIQYFPDMEYAMKNPK